LDEGEDVDMAFVGAWKKVGGEVDEQLKNAR
jgi:hypothetical protein